jgi:hypothetical protein
MVRRYIRPQIATTKSDSGAAPSIRANSSSGTPLTFVEPAKLASSVTQFQENNRGGSEPSGPELSHGVS